MEQTIITLLIAAGGAVFGVLVIAGGYLAARAAMRDANGVLRKVPTPEPKLYVTRPESTRRSGGKPERVDPVRVRESMILELQRTRSILLGWLSVLEAFALGDAWRATALRAELGDINTCDVSLVGDANVIATYQLTVDMLRNQAGRGLPPDVASQMASIRVRLLTALAEQERRLTHGERPQIAEPLGHLDLWGPPRPITEVIRSATEAPGRPLLGDDSGTASSMTTGDRVPLYLPEPGQPVMIRSASPAAPAARADDSSPRLAPTTTDEHEEGTPIPAAPIPESAPEATGPAAELPATAAGVRATPARRSGPRTSRRAEVVASSGGIPDAKPPARRRTTVATAPPVDEPAAAAPGAAAPTAPPPSADPPATATPTRTKRTAAKTAGAKPAEPGEAAIESPRAPIVLRASSRPILRALPDAARPSRAGSRTTGTGGTNRTARPAPPQVAAPPKPAEPPATAATTPGPTAAGKRTTSAVAKPAAPSARKPPGTAGGPIGPAAMATKPAVRPTARRSAP